MKDLCFPGTFPPTLLSQTTATISAFLTVFITTGNSLILIAIIKDPKKQLRSPFAYFLANLTLSDFMVGVIAMPVSVMFHIMESKRKIDKASIYIVHVTFFLSLAASLFSMAAMCFDRYVTIMSLSTQERRFTRKRCTIVSFAIWMVSIAFTSLYFLTGYITLVTIYLNVSFICIFGITLLTYVRILRSLKAISKVINDRTCTEKFGPDITNSQPKKYQRSRTINPKISRMNRAPKSRNAAVASSVNVHERQQSNEKVRRQKSRYTERRRIATEQRITRVFLAMLATFLSSNLPAIVFTYILQFCLSCSCDLRHVFRDIVFLLLPTASGLNALICILKMPNVRQAVKEILRCNRKNLYKFNSTDIGEISRGQSAKERYKERDSKLLSRSDERHIWNGNPNPAECGLQNYECQNSQSYNSYEYKCEVQEPICTTDNVQDHEKIALANVGDSKGNKRNIRRRSNSFPASYRAQAVKADQEDSTNEKLGENPTDCN